MPKYKVAVSGYMLVEVDANNEEEASDKIWEEEAVGELYNLEILEIVPSNEPLKMYTDLN